MIFTSPLYLAELDERNRQNRECNRNNINTSNDNNLVKSRLASLDKAHYLLRSKDLQGNRIFTDREVSRFAKVSLYDVEGEKNRIEKEDRETRRFLRTGQIKGEGGYYAILQR